MSEYREECIKRKAVQAGIVEQRPVSGKSGKARPVIVEYRTMPGHPFEHWGSDGNPWRKWKAYRNVAEAEVAMVAQNRKHSALWEFRLREESKPEAALQALADEGQAMGLYDIPQSGEKK